MKLKLLTIVLFAAVNAHAEDMNTADIQCRADAKEIAIKSYQSCITEARTARLENIRKEYQEKLAELKKQYDSQLQELKAQKNTDKKDIKSEPTIVLKKASSAKADKKNVKAEKKVVSAAKPKKTTEKIITEAELEKSAPPVVTTDSATASSEAVETNTTTGETENLQMVDPSLPAEQ